MNFSQNRHWNHTKIVRQLIVINFLKSLPLHCFFRSRIAHELYLIYHFFCILNFDSLFFFHISYNILNYSDLEYHNFSKTEWIFISNFSQHKYWKTEETYVKWKNRIETSKTQWNWCVRTCMNVIKEAWTQF